MAQNSGKFVCYYRVSTGRQGKSGLGLEAQREAVKAYLNGGDWQIVDEYTEIESGKKSDRPALEKALASARGEPASIAAMVGGLPVIRSSISRYWRGSPSSSATMLTSPTSACWRKTTAISP